MDYQFDTRTEELSQQLREFMTAYVNPAEAIYAEQTEEIGRWEEPPIIALLQAHARRKGLWNLAPRASSATAVPDPDATADNGLTNLQYAPLAEITGRSPVIAPRALNCAAPDTTTMDLLTEFGTPEQQDLWLKPLLDAQIRSAVCVSEPHVASSDPANIATRIERDGADYLITGRKWWATGALSDDCAILVVLGRTNPTALPHRQHSLVLVPKDLPGVTLHRGLTVFGYANGGTGGHAEITFDQVRVPVTNLIAAEGDGTAIAQSRSGPSRVQHCMRLIGMAERGLELMCRRATARVTFGRPLAEQGVVREWIAESRVRIDQARLLVLRAAWLIDTAGAKAAHSELLAIKIVTPSMTEWVLDKAIQTYGAAGVGQDLPLASLWSAARTARFVDGPDEVHKRSLARLELRKHRTT